jgi:predicted DNA-binding protein
MTDRAIADDVLDHSEDDGEWDEEPEVIERRPRGTQVVSARLPVDLAQQVLAEASRRGAKPSELVREAIEHYFRRDRTGSVTAYAGQRVRLWQQFASYETENPAVTDPAPNLVALGIETLDTRA